MQDGESGTFDMEDPMKTGYKFLTPTFVAIVFVGALAAAGAAVASAFPAPGPAFDAGEIQGRVAYGQHRCRDRAVGAADAATQARPR